MGLPGLKEARLAAEQVGRRVHENGEKAACKWASRLLRFGLDAGQVVLCRELG